MATPLHVENYGTLSFRTKLEDDVSGAYDWATCGRDKFDRLVEALIHRYYENHPEGWSAEAVDGRGGDGGIDIDVTAPDGTLKVIYQLKYFTEGFSNKFTSRRRQIKSSYDEAAKLSPERWVLVIPGKPTPRERSWVRSLPGKSGIVAKVIGRDQLDSWLAQNRDVYDYFTRSAFKDALATVAFESKALTTASEVSANLFDLRRRLGAQSIYWDRAVTLHPSGVEQIFIPKRDDAMMHEPLGFHLTLSPEGKAQGASAAFERFMDFGGPEVVLTREQVERLELIGPEWFADEARGVEVRLGTEAVGEWRTLDLRAVDVDDCTVASVIGKVRLRGQGRRGLTLEFEIPGGIAGTALVPSDRSEQVRLDFKLRVGGEPVSAVVAVLRLLDVLEHGEGMRVEFLVKGEAILRLVAGTGVAEGKRDAYTRQLIEDLDVIAKYANISFSVPDELTWGQRVEIRKCRLLIEGHVILEPDFDTWTGTLNGRREGGLEKQLRGGLFQLVWQGPIAYDVLGHRVTFDKATVWHPQSEAEDARALADALREGKAAGRRLRVKGADGSPFRVFVEERLVDRSAPLVVTPLGIEDPED